MGESTWLNGLLWLPALGMVAGIWPARWLARNSMMRSSAPPLATNGSSAMIASTCARLDASARMMPPSRGIFRPETRNVPAA